MTDSKITDLTALTGANLATGDVFEVSDVSDTTMDASGTSKKIAASELHLPGDDLWKPQAILSTSVAYLRPGWFYANTWSDAGTIATAGDTYYMPIYCATSMQFDRLCVSISTAGAAGKLARLGIYTMGSNRMPDALVVDAGTVAVDSTGAKEATISTTLAKGYYYLAFVSDGAPTPRAASVNGTSWPAFPMTIGGTNALNGPGVTPRVAGRTADVAGGLPSAAPTMDFGVTGGGRTYPFLRMVTGT